MTKKLFLSLAFATSVGFSQTVPAEYDAFMKSLGKQGDFKDNVLKVNIPRNDLKVTIDGIATPTPFGFGGWLALTKGDKGGFRGIPGQAEISQIFWRAEEAPARRPFLTAQRTCQVNVVARCTHHAVCAKSPPNRGLSDKP